ncbi:MAG: type II toxin-antitoxin system PemK/MazF family toxin [Tangfeifania sp.]
MMKNDIVLVPFSFDDFSLFKVRPAICLTNTFGKFDHIIIAFISSNTKKLDNDIDILVKRNDHLAEGSGLKLDSVIKINRIVTIPKRIIARKLGIANPELSHVIKMKLKLLFELE